LGGGRSARGTLQRVPRTDAQAARSRPIRDNVLPMKKLTSSAAYGWVIVVVAALAMVATLPGRTHGVGMITERMLADSTLEIDRVSYSDMNLWATLLGATFCLGSGRLIDRFGLRINLTITVAALGLVVLWMTKLSGYWLLFIAIFLTR